LTLAPGVTTLTVSIAITGDTTVEADETFVVQLFNAIGVPIVDAVGVGTIVNDEV
jgi:chitinase